MLLQKRKHLLEGAVFFLAFSAYMHMEVIGFLWRNVFSHPKVDGLGMPRF